MCDSTPGEARQGASDERGKGRISSLILLGLILLLGLGLRLHRLRAESVDPEEYVCVAHFDAPDVPTFFRRLRVDDPFMTPMAPVPWVSAYLWAQVIGDSVVGARLLFVFFGMLMIPLTYLCAVELYGRTAFGRRAGLVAALCLAMSPISIFHAQEVRHYGLLALVGLASAYFFLRALHEGRTRWWALNLLANALIVWVHLFGVLLVLTEGLFLLIARWKRLRQFITWTSVHVLFLIPWGIWVLVMVFLPRNIAPIYSPPTLRDLAWDLVGDEIGEMAAALRSCQNMWGFVPDGLGQWLTAAYPWFDRTMIALFCACAAWGVWQLLRRGLPAGKGRADRARRPRFGDYAFLLMWFVVPPLTVFILSHVWKPCHQCRYTEYHMIALYILVGGAIASLPHISLRACAVAAVVVLYGYQISVTLSGPVRSDWKGVAGYIGSYGCPDDPILVEGGQFWLRVFRFDFNRGDLPNPTCGVFDLEALADTADFYLKECGRSRGQGERDHTCGVWVLLVGEGRPGPVPEFDEYTRQRGLTYTAKGFTGERYLLAYRFLEEPGAGPRAVSAHGEAPRMDALARAVAERRDDSTVSAFWTAFKFIPDSEGGAYARLGIALAKKGAVDVAAAAFGKSMAVYPLNALKLAAFQEKLTGADDLHGTIGSLLRALKSTPDGPRGLTGLLEELQHQGQHDFVLEVARKGVELDPGFATGYAYLGAALQEKDDSEAAIAAFRKALELDANKGAWVYINLAAILQEQGKAEQACDVLGQGAEHHPDVAWMHMNLGTALLERSEYDAAVAAMRKAVELEPPDANIWMILGETLVNNGEYDDAVHIMRRSVGLDPGAPRHHWVLARALLGNGEDKAALDAIHRAFALDAQLAATWEPLVGALYETKDHAAAQDEMDRLIAAGTPVPLELIQKLARDSKGQK